LIPEKDPNLFASKISLLSPSATKRKSSGERGQPCLKPLSEEKKGEAEPLISTAKETVVRQFMTHLMKGDAKPKCVNNK